MGEVVPPQSSSSFHYPASSSHFTDSKVVFDLTNANTKAWLLSAGLFDFASLPWESWKCNSVARQQFKFLQISNLYVTLEVPFIVELVSYVF